MSAALPSEIQALFDQVSAAVPGAVQSASVFRDNYRLHVEPGSCHAVLKHLKEQAGFAMLLELSAADYLQYPEATDRYGLWYILLNLDTNQRIIIKTVANDPEPAVDSVVDLWEGANWMEREVFDLYGIEFRGHPDLRRILLPDEFVGHPLRRDYPMRGKGERHNFPVLTRAEG